MYAKYKYFTSEPIYPTSGILQWSYPSALLLFIFMNDLHLIIRQSNVQDDLKMYWQIKSNNDIIKIQHDIRNNGY